MAILLRHHETTGRSAIYVRFVLNNKLGKISSGFRADFVYFTFEIGTSGGGSQEFNFDPERSFEVRIGNAFPALVVDKSRPIDLQFFAPLYAFQCRFYGLR